MKWMGMAALMIAATGAYASGLQDLRFDRPIDFNRVSTMDGFKALLSANKPWTFQPSYRWNSDASITGFNFRYLSANPVLDGALEFRFGVGLLDIKENTPPPSALPSRAIGGVGGGDSTGYSAGIGWQSFKPLAEGINWGWDFDYVRDSENNFGYSPSVTLSYAPVLGEGMLAPTIDLTLGYEFIDIDGAGDDSSTSAALGLSLAATKDWSLHYVYSAPSKLGDYGYSIRAVGVLPGMGMNGLKLILGWERDDVKYVGASFRF